MLHNHLGLNILRCLSGAILSLSCGVWDTIVPNGDFIRSVHSRRIYHLLEETVSTGTRYIYSVKILNQQGKYKIICEVLNAHVVAPQIPTF